MSQSSIDLSLSLSDSIEDYLSIKDDCDIITDVLNESNLITEIYDIQLPQSQLRSQTHYFINTKSSSSFQIQDDISKYNRIINLSPHINLYNMLNILNCWNIDDLRRFNENVYYINNDLPPTAMFGLCNRIMKNDILILFYDTEIERIDIEGIYILLINYYKLNLEQIIDVHEYAITEKYTKLNIFIKKILLNEEYIFDAIMISNLTNSLEANKCYITWLIKNKDIYNIIIENKKISYNDKMYIYNKRIHYESSNTFINNAI